MTEQEKIVAAREAVETAAALLLEHAEGLAYLAILAKIPDEMVKRPLTLDDAGGTLILRNEAAERSWRTVSTYAAAFAGYFEAHLRDRDRMLGIRDMVLREAVERQMGPEGGMPPPISRMPAEVGDAELGVNPRACPRAGLARLPDGVDGEGAIGGLE